MPNMWLFLPRANSITRLWLMAGLALGAAVPGIGVRPAWAQLTPSGMASLPQSGNPSSLTGGPVSVGQPPQIKQPQASPPALPGAVPRSDRVAPAQGAPIADPTEALFDAINRGDIASARDAIDRGADLNGQNVLGLSPLDVSVDLGRNDITFLLLSLRGADSRPGRNGPAQTAQGTAHGGPNAKPGATRAVPLGKTSTGGQTRAAARAPTPPAGTQAAPAAPRLFAGDGGTPNPGVGFLGFDARH
jgi:hypothetical protein